MLIFDCKDWDLEIRKRFAQPLAVESGEFPDTSSIEARMLPFCYEAGLVNGHGPEVAQLMTIATETFIKEMLSAVFARTRSNGPGDSASAGFGSGPGWIQTKRYRQQLRREEDALIRGEVSRDKSGLLPVEAKAASERQPLGMADLRLALDLGDCGLGSFPIVAKSVVYNYREGELENWDDYSWIDEGGPPELMDLDMLKSDNTLTNGIVHAEPMEIDDQWGWEGTDEMDLQALDSVLDSCLAVGS
jgi:transcriptional coactivator HFI1/ADA1